MIDKNRSGFLFPLLPIVVLMIILTAFLGWMGNKLMKMETVEANLQAVNESADSKMGKVIATIPIASLPPTPTPTPKPLTFEQMNEKYGPCTRLPILMYHHIQTPEEAAGKKQTSLTVNTDVFRQQMEYLKSNNYQSIDPNDLIKFFDEGISLPKKAIMITVDDGYADNFTQMYPILRDNNIKATVFLATGLMENPDYLNWAQVSEMANKGIYFGNHTWSHQNMMTQTAKVQYEITTAQKQLEERGLNQDKIFAYPYGLESNQATKLLTDENFRLAFSTISGSTQCKQKRFELYRIRVGNANFPKYGL